MFYINIIYILPIIFTIILLIILIILVIFLEYNTIVVEVKINSKRLEYIESKID